MLLKQRQGKKVMAQVFLGLGLSPLTANTTQGHRGRSTAQHHKEPRTPGVEVKNGESLKVSPGDGRVLHLSQASLGELKDKKGKENVNLFVNVDGKKLVLGTLITNKLPQQQFDLLFDWDFELSHNWKSGSVYFYGYKANKSFGEYPLYESESEEDIALNLENDGKTELMADQEKPADADRANASNEKKSDAGRDLVKIAETHKDLNTQEDEETTFEDLVSDDEDKDDFQVETSKKRPLKSVEFATVTPIPEKRAKGPEGTDTAPLIANEANKAPPTNQPNKQTLKRYPCKTCSRSFTSEQGVESHTKAKHGDAMQS
ncbi:histone deacetylase 3 [Perilla frutescens var. hirtella]|nr:histone deacetylase 3 [Perilla frutescens var. hirtella]